MLCQVEVTCKMQIMIQRMCSLLMLQGLGAWPFNNFFMLVGQAQLDSSQSRSAWSCAVQDKKKETQGDRDEYANLDEVIGKGKEWV